MPRLATDVRRAAVRRFAAFVRRSRPFDGKSLPEAQRAAQKGHGVSPVATVASPPPEEGVGGGQGSLRLCVGSLRLCEKPRRKKVFLAEAQSEDAEPQICKGRYAPGACRRMIAT